MRPQRILSAVRPLEDSIGGKTTEDLIVVGPPKIFEVRELENMLRVAEAQLSQLATFDAQKIPAAIGNVQGATSRESAFGLSARDLLTEQMSLTHQIVNLRLLLKSSLSDRMELGGIDWLQVATALKDGRTIHTMGPHPLGLSDLAQPGA